MKRIVPGILLVLLAATPLFADTKVVLSDVYTIEKVYRSMEGPSSMKTVLLGEDTAPELMWITSVKTEMVGEDGKTQQLPELMCHVNVDIDANKHQKLFNFKRPTSSRLVTLSQGMLSMKAPKGFGFPVVSNEPILLYTQVLNHNIAKPGSIKVRHRLTFEYVRDRDLTEPLKPLFNLGAAGMVILDNNPLAIPSPVDAGGAHGASCLMAPRAPNAMGTGSDYVDPSGRKLTGHWVVPPGKQVNHTDTSWFLGLPYDTTLHYAAIHLHPFAESLSFRDVTEDKTIFTVKAKNPRNKVGLDHVDSFASAEGVKLFKDHQYEIISVYNNTTSENHDSMASVFLGVLDPEFRKPAPEVLEARANALFPVRHELLLKTSRGDVGVMIGQEAPSTVRQFAAMVKSGALEKATITAGRDFGGAPAITFTTKLDENQKKLLGRRTGVEKGRPHGANELSVCPEDNAGESFVFSLVLEPAPHRDGRCTSFAQLGPGGGVVREIYETLAKDEPPASAIKVLKSELFTATDIPTTWISPAGM